MSYGVKLYRKKPVVIEALQFVDDENGSNAAYIAKWVVANLKEARVVNGKLMLKTLESDDGWHIVSPNDWVICGIGGEFYPCKPGIVAATYEPADPPSSAASEPGQSVDNYVAWLCFDRHENGDVSIHVCDSDTKGAFKVYRHPAQPISEPTQWAPYIRAIEKSYYGSEAAVAREVYEMFMGYRVAAQPSGQAGELRKALEMMLALDPQGEDCAGANDDCPVCLAVKAACAALAAPSPTPTEERK